MLDLIPDQHIDKSPKMIFHSVKALSDTLTTAVYDTEVISMFAYLPSPPAKLRKYRQTGQRNSVTSYWAPKSVGNPVLLYYSQ